MSEDVTGRRELSLRERRAMGLTLRNVRRTARELAAAGEITREMSRAEIAAIVADRIAGENPRAFDGLTEIEWDAVLAFIERLLELLIKFLPYFL